MRAILLVLFTLLPVRPCPAAPAPERLAELQRGINITGWFRFAGGQRAESLHAYIADSSLKLLARTGFTFVRLPFDPVFALVPERRAILLSEIARIERAGLAVVTVLAPADWNLETRQQDRAALLAVWQALAPALVRLPSERTFPEILNEPVFSAAPDLWNQLQREALAVIRRSLPDSTIVLSGPDWSSVAGLSAAAPPPDDNTLYTIHFYDPAELTALAAYRNGIDRKALARLPFPMRDPQSCKADAASHDPDTISLVAFVCSQGWDAAAIGARIAQAGEWSRRTGVPVLLGEFGASALLNAPARLAWIRAVRQSAEHAGMGWALWGLDDVMGFDLRRPIPSRTSLDPSLLAALGLRLDGQIMTPDRQAQIRR